MRSHGTRLRLFHGPEEFLAPGFDFGFGLGDAGFATSFAAAFGTCRTLRLHSLAGKTSAYISRRYTVGCMTTRSMRP